MYSLHKSSLLKNLQLAQIINQRVSVIYKATLETFSFFKIY